jgi:hypothetical protein
VLEIVDGLTRVELLTVTTADNVSVGEFLLVLADSLGVRCLPFSFLDNHPELTGSEPVLGLFLRRTRGGVIFGSGEKRTLAEIGVESFEEFHLLPNCVPGIPDLEEKIVLKSGLSLRDAALVVALEEGGYTGAFVIPRKLPLASLPIFLQYQMFARENAGLPWVVIGDVTQFRLGSTREVLSIPHSDTDQTVGDCIRSGEVLEVIRSLPEGAGQD